MRYRRGGGEEVEKQGAQVVVKFIARFELGKSRE